MEISQGSILITGATGFIGRRLTQRLLDDGFPVRCMVRNTTSTLPDGAEIVKGDMLEPATLGKALAGVDTAYYLVHSMSGGRAGFEHRDRDAAEDFFAADNKAHVRDIIPLQLKPYDDAVRCVAATTLPMWPGGWVSSWRRWSR